MVLKIKKYKHCHIQGSNARTFLESLDFVTKASGFKKITAHEKLQNFVNCGRIKA